MKLTKKHFPKLTKTATQYIPEVTMTAVNKARLKTELNSLRSAFPKSHWINNQEQTDSL